MIPKAKQAFLENRLYPLQLFCIIGYHTKSNYKISLQTHQNCNCLVLNSEAIHSIFEYELEIFHEAQAIHVLNIVEQDDRH